MRKNPTGTLLGPSAQIDVWAYGYREAANEAVLWAINEYGWDGATWGKATVIKESPDPADYPSKFRVLVSERTGAHDTLPADACGGIVFESVD